MNKTGLILRAVVIFLFPVPFLLSFAVSQGANWAGFVAYVAMSLLVAAAAFVAWRMRGRGD